MRKAFTHTGSNCVPLPAINSASGLLSDLQTNLQNSISETDGYNEAQQISLLAYHQQLAANAAAGLSILRQQRAAAVQMLQQIAGLTAGWE